MTHQAIAITFTNTAFTHGVRFSSYFVFRTEGRTRCVKIPWPGGSKFENSLPVVWWTSLSQ